MAVKVLIERWVKTGYEHAVWERLRDLRSQAVRQRGYLYGETWRSLDNPTIFMVVSVWGSREHWESWANDEFRQKIDEAINLMLRRPCTIRVFEEVSTLPPITERTAQIAEQLDGDTPLGT